MKSIIAILLSITTMVFSVNAQESKEMHHKHFHQKGMMLSKLNLTQSQKEQLKANREAYQKAVLNLEKNELITLKDYRTQKEELHKTQKAKMMAMLTPEQKNQLVQLKQERKAKHEMMAAQRMEKMKTWLNLTDEQVAKIKAERSAIHSQVIAIRENEKLSQVEKKEQIMALKEQHKGSIKKYLTPEQISKMEELKKNRMEKKAS